MTRPDSIRTLAAAALVAFALPGTATAYVPICDQQVELDPKEFIFVGRVRSRVGPTTSTDGSGEVWGTRVAIEHPVYLPEPIRVADIFTLHAHPSSLQTSAARAWLEQQLPVGTEVLVWAWPTEKIRSSGPVSSLATTPCRGGIVRSPVPGDIAASRVLDYEEVLGLGLEWRHVLGYGDTRVVGFEVQKDLARLKAASRTEKLGVLERLSAVLEIPFAEIAKKSLGKAPSPTHLIEAWKSRRGPVHGTPIHEASFVPCLPSDRLEIPKRFDGEGGSTPPRRLDALQPDLTSLGIPLPQRSTGVVDVIIDLTGVVRGVRITTFGGPHLADPLIRQTACRWRFTPSKVGKRAVPVWDSIVISVGGGPARPK